MTKRKGKKRGGGRPKADRSQKANRSKKPQPPQPLTATGVLLAAGFGEPDPLFNPPQPPKEAPQTASPPEPPKADAEHAPAPKATQTEQAPQPAPQPSALDKLSPQKRAKIIAMGPKAVHLYESQLAQLSKEQIKALQADNLRAMEQDRAEKKLFHLYPDTGPLRRELYPKHTRFFAAGGTHEPMPECGSTCDGTGHTERAFVAGNRVGKSVAVSFELVCHLTGLYPTWWVGRRFTRPINAWAAGEDVKAVRESLQIIILGTPDRHGTGIIPKRVLLNTTPRAGVPEAVDTIAVRHVSGGVSRCLLKTYDQGRESFQGAQVDVMVFDEEPPMPIYTEGQTRTLSTVPGQPSGIVMCAFTPLRGLSDVVLAYLPMGGKVAA